MHVLLFIYKNLDHYKARFWFVLACGLTNSLAAFLTPVTLAEFAKQGLTPVTALRLVATITGLYVVSLVMSYVVRSRGEALSEQFANHISAKFFRRLEKLSVQVLTTKHSGYVLSLVSKVAGSSTQVLFSLFWELVPGMLSALLFFVFMARESVPLAIGNAAIFVVFVAVSVLLSRRMVPLSANLNRKQAALTERFVDFMANIITIKKLGITTFAQNKLQDRTTAAAKQIERVQIFHARRWFLLHALFGLAYILTLGLLVWQIGQGHASVSLLILFVSAYGIIRSLIERLSENIKLLMEVQAYLHDLEGIVGASKTTTGTANPSRWQHITFTNIVFRHHKDGAKVSVPAFTVKAGERVCIQGESGQGKSTFLNLIANFLQPAGGLRELDSKPYKQIGPAFFENNITFISQEAELFNISVRENITLGANVPDEKIVSLLKELELGAWLGELEHGLDTIVGEKGVRLSAGQKQRLNILRGVLLGRSLYLLDEPTSHLDSAVEAKVVTFLQKHLKGKAAVIVTHRPALKKLCDRTYVMKAHELRQA